MPVVVHKSSQGQAKIIWEVGLGHSTGQLSEQRHPTNLHDNRATSGMLAAGVEFLYSYLSFFFFLLSGRQLDILFLSL